MLFSKGCSMASDVVQNVSLGQMLLEFGAGLGLLLLLCSLCTLCKRRRKRKMRNLCPSGVALVDVSLLRQTQLRSLSKSDTKLHEIQKPRPGNAHLRPVSMDPAFSSPRWQFSSVPADNDPTYSNLSFPAKIPQCGLYESVTSRAQLGGPGDPKPENVATVEYATVRKVKKGRPIVAQGCNESPPPTDTCTVSTEEALLVEDMYSKVNKKKRPVVIEQGTTELSAWSRQQSAEHILPTQSTAGHHPQDQEHIPLTQTIVKHHPQDQERIPPNKSTAGGLLQSPEHIQLWGAASLQPEENVYESICEMKSGSLEAHVKSCGGILSDF